MHLMHKALKERHNIAQGVNPVYERFGIRQVSEPRSRQASRPKGGEGYRTGR